MEGENWKFKRLENGRLELDGTGIIISNIGIDARYRLLENGFGVCKTIAKAKEEAINQAKGMRRCVRK